MSLSPSLARFKANALAAAAMIMVSSTARIAASVPAKIHRTNASQDMSMGWCGTDLAITKAAPDTKLITRRSEREVRSLGSGDWVLRVVKVSIFSGYLLN